MNTTECKARDPPQRLTHLELVRMLSPEFLRVQWAGLQSKSWRDACSCMMDVQLYHYAGGFTSGCIHPIEKRRNVFMGI